MSDSYPGRAELEALIDAADEKSLRRLAHILMDAYLRLNGLIDQFASESVGPE